MKNPAFIFSLLKRFVGIIFLVLNYLCYGLMVKLAADSSLSALERIIYPSLVYLDVLSLGGTHSRNSLGET